MIPASQVRDHLRDGLRPKLNTEEAADYVGLGKSTLDKLRVFGGGPPYIKIGVGRGRVIYDPDDLDAWLVQNKRRSTSSETSASSASAGA